jgi:hypothetical protein
VFEVAGQVGPGKVGGEQHASCPPPQQGAGRGCGGLSACRANCEVELTHGELEVTFGPESMAVHVVVVGGADLLQIVKAGGDPVADFSNIVPVANLGADHGSGGKRDGEGDCRKKLFHGDPPLNFVVQGRGKTDVLSDTVHQTGVL